MCGWILTLECVCGGEGKTVGIPFCHSPSFPRETVFLLDLELGWYPASSREPPVSSPSITGITNACSHTWIFFVWLLEFEFRSLSLNSKCSFLPTETSRQPHQVTTDVVSFFLTLGKIKVSRV